MFCKQFYLKEIIRKTFTFFLFVVLLLTTQSLFASKDNSEKSIYFYPNTDVIKEESQNTIKNLVLLLKNDKESRVKLEGFTNSIGVPDAELELSKKRALKIAFYLKKEGIKDERISFEGFGGNNLVVDKVSELNRRVEVSIIKAVIHETVAKAEEKNVEVGDRRVTIEICDADNHTLVADLEVKKKINDDLELLKSTVVRKKSITIDVPNNEEIELLASADGYMPKKVDLAISESYKKIILERIEIGKSYSIENIYFDSLKSSIKRKSYDILNKIANVLYDNPGMKVKIIGHTQVPCQKLSEDRATSVIKYFHRRRIDDDRLIAEGHSNKALIGSTLKEQGIKTNMRVEFIFFE